jgi:peptide/nickel transport system substrate-binding protein
MKITKFMNAVMMTAAITFGGGAVQAQQSGGSLVFLVQPEPPTMAGYVSTSGPIGLLGPKIYDGLFDYDNDGKMVPVLAESVDISEDGKTVTFNLRKGVTWHDGKPFTSADVQFTIMDVLKKVHPRGPNSFKEVSSIDTPDAHTVVLNLDNPAPYMLRALSAYESPMVPKHHLEGEDIKSAKLANNPVGTGPFKFTEWKKMNLTGKRVALTSIGSSVDLFQTPRPVRQPWKKVRYYMPHTTLYQTLKRFD